MASGARFFTEQRTKRDRLAELAPETALRGAPAEVEREIRRRAYELYEQRGRVDGHELDDWLQAEADVLETDGETAGAGLRRVS